MALAAVAGRRDRLSPPRTKVPVETPGSRALQLDERERRALRQWLADRERRDAALLSTGNQGSTYLYAAEPATGTGRRLVIKRAGTGALTGWLHRHMLRREARIYAQLARVDGVPHSAGLLDGKWLVLEYIEGEALRDVRFELRDPETFYARLHAIIRACHAAGVAHGDLKNKHNVLVTDDERPFVIDFGAAWLRDGGWVDRLMYRVARRVDHNAWIKTKYNRDYSAVTDADRQWYRPSRLEAVHSALLKGWRALTFRQARKRRRRSRDSG